MTSRDELRAKVAQRLGAPVPEAAEAAEPAGVVEQLGEFEQAARTWAGLNRTQKRAAQRKFAATQTARRHAKAAGA